MKDRKIGPYWLHVCFGEYSYAGYDRWKWFKKFIHIKLVREWNG